MSSLPSLSSPSIRADYKMKVKKLFSPLWDLCGHPGNAKQGRKVELSEGLNFNTH